MIVNINVEIKMSLPHIIQSGVRKYGKTLTANSKAKKLLGDQPKAIDMIRCGIRKRTTRSEKYFTEIKQKLKVGDYIICYGNNKIKKEKLICKVTDIYDKNDDKFISNWYKEGWCSSDIKNILGYKDGAGCVEFEYVKQL